MQARVLSLVALLLLLASLLWHFKLSYLVPEPFYSDHTHIFKALEVYIGLVVLYLFAYNRIEKKTPILSTFFLITIVLLGVHDLFLLFPVSLPKPEYTVLKNVELILIYLVGLFFAYNRIRWATVLTFTLLIAHNVFDTISVIFKLGDELYYQYANYAFYIFIISFTLTIFIDVKRTTHNN